MPAMRPFLTVGVLGLLLILTIGGCQVPLTGGRQAGAVAIPTMAASRAPAPSEPARVESTSPPLATTREVVWAKANACT